MANRALSATYLNDLMFRAPVMALFLVALAASITAQPVYRSGDMPKQASNNRITVGENLQVSVADRDIAIGEFLVAAHPADPNVLLACANVFSSETNRMWVTAYRSADRGVVWTRVLETATLGLGNDGDPSCTFGPNGNVYVATIAMPQYGNFTSPFYVKLFRSSDDGVKWTQSSALPLKWQGFDREFLVVDNTGGPNRVQRRQIQPLRRQGLVGCSLAIESLGRNLMATRRRSFVSFAGYTSPIPPAPSCERIS